MKINLIVLNVAILFSMNTFFLIKCEQELISKEENMNYQYRLPLAGLEVLGFAVLAFVAKKVFNLCRPEIEKDVDHAIETTVPEVKEEIDHLLASHPLIQSEFDQAFDDKAIEKALEKDIAKEFDNLTRRLSKNLLNQLGTKLTPEEIYILTEFSQD